MLACRASATSGSCRRWWWCGAWALPFRRGAIVRRTPMKNRLRVLRAERDWSQGELAEQLGVSRQTVNALETGKYDPSLPLAFKIASVFGQRIEDIFQYDPASDGRKV